MTIGEVFNKLDIFDDDERSEYVIRILDLFSPLSHKSIQKFQSEWDCMRSWLDFRTEQNVVIRQCITCETGFIGNHVRKSFGLHPITMDTELT